MQQANFKRGEDLFQEAETLYREALKAEPRFVEIHYEAACNYSLWGKRKQAIDSLWKSAEFGFADKGLLDTNIALDPVRDNPGFDDILKKVGENIDAPLLVLPKVVEPETPTILFLHGWGDTHQSYKEELEKWAELGWIAMAFQAPDALDDGGFRWPLDDVSKTKASLDSSFQHPLLQGVKKDTLFVAGFSQGASYSIRLALAYPEEFRGSVAVTPGAWEPSPKDIESSSEKTPVLYLILGKKDHPTNVLAAETVAEARREKSWLLDFFSHPGGHKYPDDWEVRRSVIAAFLLRNR